MTERKQLDSLTGLRILAAVWVMLHHFRSVTPTRTFEFPLIDRFVLQGLYGVDLFFVLSGFILSHVYFEQFRQRTERADFRAFLTFRFARLYPVHLVTFLTMVLLFVGEKLLTGGSSAEAPGRYSVRAVVSTLTMTNAWWGTTASPNAAVDTTPNVPAWSISAEWFAYLLFPVLCLVIARLRYGPLIFVVVGCGLATVWDELISSPLLRVMAGFLVGMATYQLVRRSPKPARVPALGTVVVVLIAVWASLGAPRVEIGILLFAALVLALTSERDWFGRVLSRRTMVYLGEVSYAVYMVHWIARVVVRGAAEKAGVLDSIPSGLLVAIYVAVTMVAAIFLYHFVERPWRSRLRRMLAPRSAERARKRRLSSGRVPAPAGELAAAELAAGEPSAGELAPARVAEPTPARDAGEDPRHRRSRGHRLPHL
jgi:peptidoglycan/LPS O-acetylase OafA/YrhL